MIMHSKKNDKCTEDTDGWMRPFQQNSGAIMNNSLTHLLLRQEAVKSELWLYVSHNWQAQLE